MRPAQLIGRLALALKVSRLAPPPKCCRPLLQVQSKRDAPNSLLCPTLCFALASLAAADRPACSLPAANQHNKFDFNRAQWATAPSEPARLSLRACMKVLPETYMKVLAAMNVRRRRRQRGEILTMMKIFTALPVDAAACLASRRRRRQTKPADCGTAPDSFAKPARLVSTGQGRATMRQTASLCVSGGQNCKVCILASALDEPANLIARGQPIDIMRPLT